MSISSYLVRSTIETGYINDCTTFINLKGKINIIGLSLEGHFWQEI